MPVSPADFEFYSRMTGQPIPNTPAGRMAIAPQVYNMRRSGGGFGRFVRGAAQGALAAGALAGAGALALATQEEMAKEGPKVKVTENMSGAESAAPSVTTAPVQQQADKQYFVPGSGEERIGAPDAEKLREIAAFRNRISGQTLVPSASVQVANESVAAQRASTSMPTDPRVGVRQQPSSGMVVTDLSNVAQVEGRPAKETNPELSAIRQQLEMYEGSPTQSPFQAGGAMEELRRQSMDVKALKQRVTDLDLPRSIRDDVAVFLTGATGGQTAPQPFTQKEANTRIVGLIKEGIEQLEGGQPTIQFPAGEGSKYESMTLDPSGDVNVKFRKGETTYSYPQTPEGSEGFSQLAEMYNNPGPAKTAGESPFVTNKGKVVESVLTKAKEPKVDQKRMRAEEQARKSVGLGSPFFQDVVNKLMGNM